MELKTELRIIRWTMIVMIISGMFGLTVFFLSEPSDSTKSVALGTKIVFSGFGEINLHNPENVNLFSTNIYHDTKLGFQISKPNDDWEIHSALDDLSSNELSSLKTKGFLDGLYIEQNHNKRFMLTVFDIQKDDFSLHNFVDQQISSMESQRDVTIPFEQVSPENDWALFAVESSGNSIPYGEQILFLKDNRLYMLQYSGDSPQTLDSEQKNDFKFIMDSFEVI
ncbi:MAG: hypothetical protein MAG458_01640 [Nitrosopumilus sp.]|nr:hypothetical protein [Nitrosopumilus sp.]